MSDYTLESILAKATDLTEAGFSVFPVGENKIPAVKWGPCQGRKVDPGEWFSWARKGIGIATGPVSQLLVLDFDGDTYEPWAAWLECARASVEDFDLRVPIVETPSGGRHAYLKTDSMLGNQKLAMEPCGKKVIFETRGKGGYVVTPGGHPGCHLSGYPYKENTDLIDEWGSVEPLIFDDVAMLLDAARLADKRPVPEAQVEDVEPWDDDPGSRPVASFQTGRPGDDFEERTEWGDLLGADGWELNHTDKAGVEYWRRPGKVRGWSATVNFGGFGKLRVFSSSVPGIEPDRFYSRFSYLIAARHAGDVQSAVTKLRTQGLGIDSDFDTEALKGALAAQGRVPMAAPAWDGLKMCDPELALIVKESKRVSQDATLAKLAGWACRSGCPVALLSQILATLGVRMEENGKVASAVAVAVEHPKMSVKKAVAEVQKSEPDVELDTGGMEALRKKFPGLVRIEAPGDMTPEVSYIYEDGRHVIVPDFFSLAMTMKAHKMLFPPILPKKVDEKNWSKVVDLICLNRTMSHTTTDVVMESLAHEIVLAGVNRAPNLIADETMRVSFASSYNKALSSGSPVLVRRGSTLYVGFSLAWAKEALKGKENPQALGGIFRRMALDGGQTTVAASTLAPAGRKNRSVYLLDLESLGLDIGGEGL